ncbi:hypothetical protein HU200_058937 [Digitaria exilis]|uniref:Uncharacterized protein n=1 Tax=Digitaria exilis TaxID=1010633 RepID=A0A835A8B9_9POAL|nr:hypothetical protein HU200_058937 [Digitaria exilis]
MDTKAALTSGGSFMHLLETDPGLRDLFSWVQSYFRSIPDTIKPCSFYLPIFHTNQIIRRGRLVRRWVAEGYTMDTNDTTAEKIAEEYFSKLLKLSMVMVPEGDLGEIDFVEFSVKASACHVNGFLREYIISRPMEDNLVTQLEGHCSMNLRGTGRHLAVSRSWERKKNEGVFKAMDFSRLRSLTVFGTWESFFLDDTIRMRLLRVLDLEDASGDVKDDDVALMVKRLPRLKFLSLRGCSLVKCLPDSLGSLSQLQTLDVRGTSIVALPSTITKLHNLRHIRAGTTSAPQSSAGEDDVTEEGTILSPAAPTESPMPLVSKPRTGAPLKSSCWSGFRRRQGLANVGVKVPGRLGILTAMQTLGIVNISAAGSEAAIEERFSGLTKLHKLEVSGINGNNSHKLFYVISSYANLESLSLWFDEDNQTGCLDGTLQPPERLENLMLCGLQGKLPEWIGQLRNLRKLSLQMTMLSQEEINIISDLPFLNILDLFLNEFQGGELKFCKRMNRLLILEISCNSRLHAVQFEYNPTMKVLSIICCGPSRVSSLRLSRLENLHNLNELWLSGSYDVALKKDLEGQIAEAARQPGRRQQPVLKEGRSLPRSRTSSAT